MTVTANLTLAQMECKCPQAFEFRSSKSFQGVVYTCTYMVLRWWNSSNLNVLVLNHSYDDEGVFGINIHHAGIKDAAEYNLLLTKYTDMVEKYSAGCQVLKRKALNSPVLKTIALLPACISCIQPLSQNPTENPICWLQQEAELKLVEEEARGQ